MTVSLQDKNICEYVDSAGVNLRVDKNAGILRGVKLIGLTSLNGRRYLEAALLKAQSLYEEAKVNVNHPKAGALTPRDYQDRLGVIRGVDFRQGQGLYGDLHFNPKHSLAEQLVWDAEHNPSNVGFSHNIQAKVSREGETMIVEDIASVQSVDLVADPAATRGLFEQEALSTGKDTAIPMWDALTIETLCLHRPDLLEQIHSAESQRLQLQLDESLIREEALRHQQKVMQLLSSHGLAMPSTNGFSSRSVVSKAFFEMLLRTPDESEVEALIVERADLLRRETGTQVQSAMPVSRDQMEVLTPTNGGCVSSSDFARAIKST